MDLTKKLLTIQELSDYLGVKKSWIYERTCKDKLPHFKLGKLLRFDLTKVEQWLEGNERGVE